MARGTGRNQRAGGGVVRIARRPGFVAAAMAMAGMVWGAGCAAVPVPILASAGVSVAQAGTAAYINGELEAAFATPLEEMHRAVLATALELEYEVRSDRMSDEKAVTVLDALVGDDVTVTLEAASPRVTKVSVRVGPFGDQAISRLVMERVQEQRTRAGGAAELSDPARALPGSAEGAAGEATESRAGGSGGGPE